MHSSVHSALHFPAEQVSSVGQGVSAPQTQHPVPRVQLAELNAGGGTLRGRLGALVGARLLLAAAGLAGGVWRARDDGPPVEAIPDERALLVAAGHAHAVAGLAAISQLVVVLPVPVGVTIVSVSFPPAESA